MSAPSRPSKDWRTLRRYAILQVPAALAVGAILIAGVRMAWLDAPTALILFVLWVLKDVALYPLVRNAYEARDQDQAARLVGRIARAREDLAPIGYVLLAGELWRAEAIEADAPIRAGERVRIESVDGLRVRVSRAQGAETLRST
jgi:membrane protein implicated in regulation of membrane protease activity